MNKCPQCDFCFDYLSGESCPQCGSITLWKFEGGPAKYKYDGGSIETTNRTLMVYIKKLEAAGFHADIIENAMDLFKRLKPYCRHRGEPLEQILAICVAIGSRNTSRPILLEQVIQKLHIRNSGRALAFVQETIKQHPITFETISISMEEKLEGPLFTVCEEMKFTADDAMRAKIILDRINGNCEIKRRISSKTLLGITCYIVANKAGIAGCKKLAAKVCNISETTIINNYALVVKSDSPDIRGIFSTDTGEKGVINIGEKEIISAHAWYCSHFIHPFEYSLRSKIGEALW